MWFGGYFNIYMACSDSCLAQLSPSIRFLVVKNPSYNFPTVFIVLVNNPASNKVNNPSFNFWFGYSLLTVFDLIVWTFFILWQRCSQFSYLWCRGFQAWILYFWLWFQNRNFFQVRFRTSPSLELPQFLSPSFPKRFLFSLNLLSADSGR